MKYKIKTISVYICLISLVFVVPLVNAQEESLNTLNDTEDTENTEEEATTIETPEPEQTLAEEPEQAESEEATVTESSAEQTEESAETAETANNEPVDSEEIAIEEENPDTLIAEQEQVEENTEADLPIEESAESSTEETLSEPESAGESPTPEEEPLVEDLPETEESEVPVEEFTPVQQPETEQVAESSSSEPTVSISPEPMIFDFSNTSSDLSYEPVCGNGLLDEGEACDDNNLDDGDGCNSICLEESPTSVSVSTGIVRGPNIQSLSVVAQWAMDTPIIDPETNRTDTSSLGLDDSMLYGAQFLPTGAYQENRLIMVCAIVADKNNADNINLVAAGINYPQDTAISIDQEGNYSGCGQLKESLSLEEITGLHASNLICNNIRNNNNTLIDWHQGEANNFSYDYDHVCGQTGLLEKNQAKVYCGVSELAYNDPAGEYQVIIKAQNQSGASAEGENYLKYFELTNFQTDFNDIQYGLIEVEKLSTLEGDRKFSTSTRPTIRNTGNTRLRLKIMQNDFNLGKTNNLWNVEYQARVGSEAEYISYLPDITTILNDPVDLGTSMNVDLSILVHKFPDQSDNIKFFGKMTLTADKAPPLSCEIIEPA